jgi:hypothetical protein
MIQKSQTDASWSSQVFRSILRRRYHKRVFEKGFCRFDYNSIIY